MEHDPELLVTLLAIQTLGGKDVPAGTDVFKGLKPALTRAKDAGLITEHAATVPSTTKGGKPTKKKVQVLQLSSQGQEYLRKAASPEALAIGSSNQALALRRNLEADRQALREEIRTSLSTKEKARTPLSPKELAGISKALTDLASRVQKLEQAFQDSGDSPILARIDQAYQKLQDTLDRVLSQGPSPGPPTTPQPASTPDSLEKALRAAYRQLRQFIEFEDGLVDIPRLYHEARQAIPNLSVEAFHRELESLWNRRQIELKVLNEVRSAAEPDKAIRRGDNLYYFVLWPNP